MHWKPDQHKWYDTGVSSERWVNENRQNCDKKQMIGEIVEPTAMNAGTAI